MQSGEPACAARGRGGGEADLVVARVGGAEGEAAGRGAFLGNDAMVVVEYFLWSSVSMRKKKGGEGDCGRRNWVITSTEMKILSPSCFFHILRSLSNSSAVYWPTTSVSLGNSSKKHFGDVPSM